MTEPDGHWTPECLAGITLEYSVLYHGETKDWLTDIVIWKDGDIYRIHAESNCKRADWVTGCGGGSLKKSFRSVYIHPITDIDTVSSDTCEIRFYVDPSKYDLVVTDYRYGPTILLVPTPSPKFWEKPQVGKEVKPNEG